MKRALLVLMIALLGLNSSQAADKPAALALPEVIAQVQPKIVKIYGAGGYRGLESYQSGMLISATGHVLTVWSYVLDTEFITVVLNDGRRFDAKLLAADPRLEAAVLKFDAQDLPYFDLAKAPQADAGARVLAFSNLFGIAVGNEPASVQHGVISARSRLDARRGGFKTPYRGPIYVTDTITNNPGAAGGALTNRRGELLGMLGKELRSAQTGAWLNYTIPAAEMAKTVDEIRAGRYVQRPADDQAAKPKQALSAELLGLVLVPDVLQRTPPYLDAVRTNSPAARVGLRADDLVVFVNGRLVPSCKSLHNELEFVDRIDKVQLTVMRGEDLVDVTLGADEARP